MTRTILLALLSTLILGAIACEEEEEVAEVESAEPVVGVMELAISLRHDAAGPNNAAVIEVSPSKLRVDGHTVLELEGGRVPDGERAGASITKLATNLSTGPVRRVATLRLHANTPYLTTVLVLGTLKAANIHEAAFEVRRGSTTDIGFLNIDRFNVREQTDEEWATFPESHQRQWDELAPHWEAMHTACREGRSVDCSYKPSNIAEGGQMQLTLFARGNAVKIEMHRFGVEDAEPSGGPAMIDGIAPPAPTGEFEEAPPATDAAFTWRFQSTTNEPSAVSATMRELCGAQPCGAMVTAEGQTPTMRILSFLGAAFPNGTPAPQILFQVPPR